MELSEEVKAYIDAKIEENIKHHCFTCKHFKFNKVGQRVCRYPGSIGKEDVKGGVCQRWALEPDPTRRVERLV